MRGHSLPSSERHSSIKPYTDRRQTAARQPSVVGYSRWRVSHLSEEGNSHRASRSLTTVRHCTSSVRTSTVRRLTTDVRHQSPGQRQAPDKHLPPARRGRRDRRDKPHQMSSGAGQLKKSVRMKKQQQGGNDSRLSLSPKQPFWDRPGVLANKAVVESSTNSPHSRASFLAACTQHSGDWLFALPMPHAACS